MLSLLACLWVLIPFSAAASLHLHDHTFVPDEVLVVTYENITLNCESRLSVLINGSVPGPPLYLRENQTTWIRVYNQMTDQNTTVHWHGLSQMVAPFSDGTPSVSQWPIAPGHYFDYEIRPPMNSAGSYFYHSHVYLQANTAAGPLIVLEKNGKPPYQYDEERIIYFSDYWNNTDTNMYNGLVASPFKWEGEVNNVLVNGLGRPNTSTSADKKCTIAPIHVDPGKTYRFRFISSTGLSTLVIAVEGHSDLRIIAADGSYTKPAKVDLIQMGSGQRYDVLIKTKTAAELAAAGKDSFIIQLATRERPTVTTSYALLTYKTPQLPISPPYPPPLSLPNLTYGYLDYVLTPIDNSTYPVPSRKDVSRTVILEVRQQNPQSANNSLPQLIWSIDDYVPWFDSTPTVPYLIALYTDQYKTFSSYDVAIQNGGFDNITKTFPAKRGEVVDIIIQAVGMGPSNGLDVHPFHMHGQHYWDLGTGNGTYNATDHDEKLNQAYQTGWSPPIRDSNLLYRLPGAHADPNVGTNWLAWRIAITDPGAWMLHCHTLAHMAMGMQSVWVMGTREQVAPLPAYLAAQYLTFGGGAYGNSSKAPMVMHYFDD